MAGLAFLGAVIGIIFAYWATKRQKVFRKKLLVELEKHCRSGTAADYVIGLVRHKVQWLKSVSLIRKPFRKEINLTVETAALILSIMGLVSALSDFDERFNGPVEGITVVILLGMIMAYIPSEWFFSARIEADLEAVLQELKSSADQGDLDDYLARAKKAWEA